MITPKPQFTPVLSSDSLVLVRLLAASDALHDQAALSDDAHVAIPGEQWDEFAAALEALWAEREALAEALPAAPTATASAFQEVIDAILRTQRGRGLHPFGKDAA